MDFLNQCPGQIDGKKYIVTERRPIAFPMDRAKTSTLGMSKKKTTTGSEKPLLRRIGKKLNEIKLTIILKSGFEPLVSGTQVRNSTRAEDFIRQPRAERLPRSEAEQVEALRHEANPSPRADPLSIYLPCSKEPQSEHGGWSEVFLDGWELVDVDREDRAGAGADPVDHGVLEQRVTVAASLQRCGKNRVEVTSGVVEGCKEKDQLKW
ncbi:hypothetical protein MSG28_013020 [Choristoneura fumiferana]|uniref:Uncharacterized protein n=1 Tax=Choristoneura fumiferana TaxID=7141 RepID=A0ACC0KRN3_CHOFU|nr:hypothetical protein MSG28_013020 [Choristoneura fumiferana]